MIQVFLEPGKMEKLRMSGKVFKISLDMQFPTYYLPNLTRKHPFSSKTHKLSKKTDGENYKNII